MQYDVKIASISWINATPNPIVYAAAATVLRPSWVPKTYVGLIATANKRPADSIDKFDGFLAQKQFRALTYCHLIVATDDKNQANARASLVRELKDPGFTPPFSFYHYPSAAVGSAIDGWEAFKAAWSFEFHKGELSPVSSIVLNGRHPNTTIKDVPSNESVLANVLIKFRAGPETDRLGVKVIQCPFHVPWVWCETLLTFNAGKLKLYGCGSRFPTHNWYLNGKKVLFQDQVGDYHFPTKASNSNASLLNLARNLMEIDYERLALYPVLSSGAPATGERAQVEVDATQRGPVAGHRYTVGAGRCLNT